MISATTESLRRVLVPFLVIGGSLVAGLLLYLITQHLVRSIAWRRRQILVARYRAVIDAVIQSGLTASARERLQRAPAAHRPVLSAMLLAPLHAARGELVSHARDAAVALGLVAEWFENSRSQRWWLRADAVRALGFVEEPSALPVIMSALGDEHKEVRAAAVEAAGRLGDPRAIPALLDSLSDSTHYQRARVIDALRTLGPTVTPALIELGRTRPESTRLAADVLGLIGTASAVDALLEWCGAASGDVRAAALGALGTIGLDDRSYYFALRALGDTDPNARAMAARALGRGQRDAAVNYLARRLDDEWLPAVHAAQALRRLGAVGLAALEARAHDAGQAGDLARQLLASRQASAAHA